VLSTAFVLALLNVRPRETTALLSSGAAVDVDP
jgi:hypothetical protein